MPARTGKHSKRTKTLMKAYKFDDKDPIAALLFLVQFKRACESNKVSEGMA